MIRYTALIKTIHIAMISLIVFQTIQGLFSMRTITASDQTDEFNLVNNELINVKVTSEYDEKEEQIHWITNIHKKTSTDKQQVALKLQNTDAKIEKIEELKVDGKKKTLDDADQVILSPEEVNSDQQYKVEFTTKLSKNANGNVSLYFTPQLLNAEKQDVLNTKAYEVKKVVVKDNLETKADLNKAENETKQALQKAAESSSNQNAATTTTQNKAKESSTSASKSTSTSSDEDTDSDEDADSDSDQSQADEKTTSKKEVSDSEKSTKLQPASGQISLAGINRLNMISLAGNIGSWEDETKYTENSDGIFPTDYWNQSESTGNADLDYRNHATNESITGNVDYPETNYFAYGQNGTTSDKEPAFWLKKYVEPTNAKDKYQVNLHVRGNDFAPLPKIEVMLVLDQSLSMNEKNKLADMKKTAKEFIETVWKDAEAREAIKIGVVKYGTEAEKLSGPVSADSKDALLSSIDSIRSQGYTFIQGGMREANAAFSNDDVQKNIIVMTDGEPTVSYKTTKTVYPDPELPTYGYAIPEVANNGENKQRIATEFSNTKVQSSGNTDLLPVRNIYEADNGYKVYTNSFSTIGEAINIKRNNVNMYGVAFDVSTKASTYTLKNIASGEGNYYEATEASELNDSFQHIARGLVRTVSSGTLTDPMGKYINYDVDSVKTEVIDGDNKSEIAGAIKYEKENGALKVTGITLGKNEEIKISYTITVDKDQADFPYGDFIQTNGPTTLKPSADEALAHFGIPSVRLQRDKGDERTDLSLHKVTNDDELIKLPAQFEIYESDKDGKIGDQPLDTKETSQGKLTFNNLDEGYYVVKESQAPDGFKGSDTEFLIKITWDSKSNQWTKYLVDGNTETEITSQAPFEVKNTLNDFEMEFKKVNAKNETLKGSEFKLTDDKGTEIKLTVDDPIFSVKDLKPGKYTLKETKSPDGYQLLDSKLDFEIKTNGEVDKLVVGDDEQQFDPLKNWKVKGNRITFDVENTLNDETSISGIKTWKDSNNNHDTRPEKIKLQLQRNEDPKADPNENDGWEDVESATKEISSDDSIDQNNWEYSFTGLERWVTERGGDEWKYRVVESSVDKYETTYGPAHINITNQLKTYSYEFDKVNEAGNRLAGAEFTLKHADSDHTHEVVSDKDNPSHFKAEGLSPGEYLLVETKSPNQHSNQYESYRVIIDENGQATTTPVGEKEPVKEIDGFAQIENKVNSFSVNFEKVDAQGEKPLGNAEFVISGKFANGDQERKLAGSGAAAADFSTEDLMAGEAYTIVETEAPNGYQLLQKAITLKIDDDGKVVVDGIDDTDKVTVSDNNGNSTIKFKIRNQAVETIDFEATKIWDDNSNSSKNRPDEVKFELQRRIDDGTWNRIDTKILTKDNADKDDANLWRVTFKDLEKENTSGQSYEYRIIEQHVDGYEIIYPSKSTVKNRLITSALEIQKVDDKGRALVGANFKLTRDDKEITNISKVGDRFRYQNLAPGKYQLSETKAPDGYTGVDKYDVEVALDGKITVKSDDGTIDITEKNGVNVAKITNHLKDFQIKFNKVTGTEPLEGAKFKLVDEDDKEITLNNNQASFSTEAIQPGTYTLTETDAPAGYNKLADPIKITISEQGKVTVMMGETNLGANINKNGDEIEITFDLANTEVGKTSLQGNKVWDDDLDNRFATRTDVKFQLQRQLVDFQDEFEDVKNKSIILKASDHEGTNQWHYHFDNLDEHDSDGNAYEYQVREVTGVHPYSVKPGKVSQSDVGFIQDITNSIDPRNVVVNKTTENGTLIDGAEFTITHDDSKVSQTAVTTKGQLTFTELVSGQYTLQETKPASGFMANNKKYNVVIDEEGKLSITNADGQVKIQDDQITAINQLNPINLSFAKVDDMNVPLKGAEFKLVDAEDEEVKLDTTDNMFKVDNLKPGTYQLSEVKTPDGYLTATKLTLKISAIGKVTLEGTDQGNFKVDQNDDLTKVSFNVINRPITTTQLSGQKVWEDENNRYNIRPDEIKVQLQQRLGSGDNWNNFKDQVVAGTKDQNTWNYSFTGLPISDATGTKYDYRVKEVAVEGYNTKIDGTTITNSLQKAQLVVNKVNTKHQPLAGAQFTLTNDKGTEIKNISRVSHQFRFTNLKAGRYTLKEENMPNGFKTDITEYDVVVDENSKITVTDSEHHALKVTTNQLQSSVEIENRLKNFDLEFIKVDSVNINSVADAEFELKDSAGKQVELKKIVAGKNAKFSAKDLQAGVYQLSETKTPEDFNQVEPITISIDEQGKVKFSDEGLISNLNENDMLVEGDDNNLISFKLANVKENQVLVSGTKIWQDKSNAAKVRPSKIEISLERRVDDKDWEAVDEQTVKGDMKEDSWHFRFNDLKETDSDGNKYEYRIIEKNLGNNYEEPIYQDGKGEQLTNNTGVKPTAGVAELTVVNKLKAAELKLSKFDGNGKKFTEAAFKLTNKNSTQQLDYEIQKGQYVWENLVAGDYQLVETAGGNGNQVNTKVYQVTVDQKGQVKIKNADTAVKVNDASVIEFRNWHQPMITKVADTKSVNLGQSFTWSVNAEVPHGIENFKEFRIFDQMDSMLDYLGLEQVQLVINDANGIKRTQNLTEGSDYKIAQAGNTVSLIFIGSDNATESKNGKTVLKEAVMQAGLTGSVAVEFKVKTRVNEVPKDGVITNQATVAWIDRDGNRGQHESADDVKSEIQIGSQQFKKIGTDNNKGLAGAKFVVYRFKGTQKEYAKYTFDENNQPTKVSWGREADATKLKSDDLGNFTVQGLANGKYYLMETKAPSGYRITHQEIPFTINATEKSKTIEVLNDPDPKMPITGSNLAMLAVGLGIIILGIGYYFWKRRDV